jgi:predicted HTH transcriptional regulator
MDMTGWLEYFVEGLATQLAEVKERGERAMWRDVLAKEFNLSERQTLALGHVLEHGSLAIQDYERLCPGIHRRTLQRDLKYLVEKELLSVEGAMNQLQYRLGSKASR